MPRFTHWLPRLLLSRPGSFGLTAVWVAALLLSPATGGRSLGVLVVAAAYAFTYGWGMLTDAGNVWTVLAARQPRRDHPAYRGYQGAAGIVVGAVFLALGVAAVAGALG